MAHNMQCEAAKGKRTHLFKNRLKKAISIEQKNVEKKNVLFLFAGKIAFVRIQVTDFVPFG